MTNQDKTLAVGAAANILFWSWVTRTALGAPWVGGAAALVTMNLAKNCKPGPLLDLATLPGSVAASVLADQKPCDCKLKGPTDAT